MAAFGVRLQREATPAEDPAVPWHFDPAVFLQSAVLDRTGQTLAVGPDLDGDRGAELLVGAPAGADGAGYAWLVWSEGWLDGG